MKGRLKAILSIVLVIAGGIVVYWNCGYSKWHSQFSKAMTLRADEAQQANEVYTQEQIDALPTALRDYCNFIGLAGRPKTYKQNIKFKNTKFVFDEKSGKVLNLDYDLWLFTNKLYRQAFCTSSMYGIPFEGIDYYDDVTYTGGMKGYLAKAIQIFDTPIEDSQRVMNITILAESAMLNPGFLLSEYITYEAIDENKVKAIITDQGVSGSGIFTYDRENEQLIFESDERQPAQERNGLMVPVGWKCIGSQFKEQNGMKVATHAQAIKVYPDEELIYFDAENITINNMF